MAILFQVVSGPNEGSKFIIEEGLKIGRTKGQVRLNDPKISGAHAVVEKDSTGGLYLSDLRSANGIILSGKKVTRVALLPGVRFRLGNTEICVLEDEKIVDVDSAKIKTWRERLLEELENVEFKNFPHSSAAIIFKPLIKLTFTKGIQADTNLYLFYGPREAGSHSLDIELFDKEAPKKAFTIEPQSFGAIFHSKALGKVKLNNKIVSDSVLKDGDVISFGATEILVGFI